MHEYVYYNIAIVSNYEDKLQVSYKPLYIYIKKGWNKWETILEKTFIFQYKSLQH